MNIGIMSLDDYRDRTIAIASGKYKPKRGEPKVWFESLKSMSQVLSQENLDLLRLIFDEQPKSLVELSRLSDRASSNLSRTLKTLARYGIVELKKDKRQLVPTVKATDFHVKFGLSQSHA